jgi:HAD superfamily hydrolase (TIGR01549 family)
MVVPDRIRAVLFDLDGTLYRQSRLRALMALELLTLPLAGPFKAPGRLAAIRAYRAAQEQLRGGGTAGAGQAQIAAAAAASGLPVAEVERLVDEWMMRRPLKYLQFCRAAGLHGLLAAIDAAGLEAGILSDYPAAAKLEALGLSHRFAPVLSASDPEIDAFKPSPRGYLRACEIWGVSPSEVLFVGDRADVDAAGAAAAGMPCAIVGRADATAAMAGGVTYTLFPSFERLTRVFDPR